MLRGPAHRVPPPASTVRYLPLLSSKRPQKWIVRWYIHSAPMFAFAVAAERRTLHYAGAPAAEVRLDTGGDHTVLRRR